MTTARIEHPAVAALRELANPTKGYVIRDFAEKALAASAAHDEAVGECVAALETLATQTESFVNLAMGRSPGTLREDAPRQVRNALASARAVIAMATKAEGR